MLLFSRRLDVISPFVSCHSHPSDLKHRFLRHHSSSSLHGSFNLNNVQETSLPLVAEEPEEHQDGKGGVYDPKQDVFVSLFVSFPVCVCVFEMLVAMTRQIRVTVKAMSTARTPVHAVY